MIQAVIFDFDGVIADTEHLHFEAFKSVLNITGLDISEKQYYSQYLAYDDKTFFTQFYNNNGLKLPDLQLDILLQKKSETFDRVISGNIKIYPGVEPFIREISKNYILAIGSGALRTEIVQILKAVSLDEYFKIIVAADDVLECKPNPEVYNKVLNNINIENNKIIMTSDCVVIEDSIYGVMAAKSAGMKCVAVTNSYSSDQLNEADIIVDILNSSILNNV